MILVCPNCQSARIGSKNLARRAGGYLGLISGATTGTSSALSGAEIGGTLGLIASPVGGTLGMLAGAMVGALVGGATGSVAGAKLGQVIDDNVLNNYECLACHYVFGHRRD